MTLLQVILCPSWHDPGYADLLSLQLLQLHMYEGSYAGLVIRMLLILYGDIEVNPGPVTSEELMGGLALL